MPWTYRLLETEEDEEKFLSLVEVLYENGQPLDYVDLSLPKFEDERQIENAISLMLGSLFKPVMVIVDGVLKERV